MPLQIIHGDITTAKCDIIVNPTDERFSGTGGVDYLIHKKAGAELDCACKKLPPLQTGEIAATNGYKLGCKYIIHTRGPIWNGGTNDETTLLKSCYLNALLKAAALKAKSVAFPLIASGTFGFPKNRVLQIAQDAIKSYLFANETDMDVFVYVLHESDFAVDIISEIDGYVARRMKEAERIQSRMYSSRPQMLCDLRAPLERAESDSLEKWLEVQDDSFAEKLQKLIDQRDMTDVECYKKANVSRKTFSKMKIYKEYKPSKQTVIAFAVALHLSLEETNALLKTVGFVLSDSLLFDNIIIYCLKHNIYDVFEINDILFKYDLQLLGC